MAEQTIQLLASWYSLPVFKQWRPPTGSRPEIDAGLSGSASRFFTDIYLTTAGAVSIRFAFSQTQSPQQVGQDLTAEFEENGSLE